jgi:hypothetical protein
VRLGANCSTALAALATAIALSGCANVDLDSSTRWFAKPFDWGGRNSGYTFSDLQQTKQERPITANDLVQPNGSCPAPPANGTAVASNPGAPAAAGADQDSLLGGGIALGMSECEVVNRAGQPNSVEIGKNPNGDRTAALTYNNGPRPGIYRFERGRLMELDRVAEPPPPPQQAKKKKPAKSAKPQKNQA